MDDSVDALNILRKNIRRLLERRHVTKRQLLVVLWDTLEVLTIMHDLPLAAPELRSLPRGLEPTIFRVEEGDFESLVRQMKNRKKKEASDDGETGTGQYL